MTSETIAIIAVGVGLGGLILTLFQVTNRRFDSIDRRFDSIDRRFDSLDRRVESLQQQQSSLTERVARLEGIVEAIRDMLIRTPAAP